MASDCSVRSRILHQIARISARFISAPSADIDAGINEALQITGELAGIDRAYVFLFEADGAIMTNTHEWCADGVPPQMHELQQVPTDDFPWTLAPIRAGRVLYVPRVVDVPDEAAKERAVFESGQIKSLICVPMICRETLIGFVGFDSVRREKSWSEDDTALLRIVADVLAGAMDRKNAMVALQESEEKWRFLAENSADHIMIIDRDFRIQFINHTIPGVEIADVIGTNILTFLEDEDVDRIVGYYKRAFETGTPEAYICPYRDPDGRMRVFESRLGPIKRDGAIVALSISATDITDAMATREALEESERRLRQMAEHIDSVLWLEDIETQTVIYISPSFERMFGVSCQELMANRRSWVQCVHPEDRERAIREADEAERTGFCDMEYRLLRPDGSIRWIHDRAFPVYDSSGHLYRLAGIVDDITDRRRVEDELSRARRLESAGQVAGQIAHDFNNLLAPMVAYPDLIRSRIEAPQSVMAMLDDLEDAATQMAEINQQLLTLGRRGHYNVAPVDLNALTDQVLRTLDLPESIVVQRELDPCCPSPMAGRAQLARVLANLIRNAAEAMDGCGTLTFRTCRCPAALAPREWENRPEGDCILWSVTDTGHGISEEVLERIFEPYFSTKKSDARRGSGLGLAVAHSVVLDHEGYLAVESRVGEGTTFQVYLPAPTNANVTQSKPGPIPSGRGERILIVDDDLIQQRVAMTILEDLGYSVSVTSSGLSAIDLVSTNPYDLIVLDMVMPGIDGTETLHRIRKLRPQLSAVILSGYAAGERVRMALDLGARQFVSKPVGKRELAIAVREALDASRAEPSLQPR
ncbi:MAG: hypothetical protein Kow0074_12690 [Candidatus Zixiibacteriota bacterium]